MTVADRPVIYMAGPYTAPDPEENTRRALRLATQLVVGGHAAPIVPHLSHFWNDLHPLPYETWLDLDLVLLARCDGVVRIPGDSPGADREVARARELELPVLELDRYRQHWCADSIIWLESTFTAEPAR